MVRTRATDQPPTHDRPTRRSSHRKPTTPAAGPLRRSRRSNASISYNEDTSSDEDALESPPSLLEDGSDSDVATESDTNSGIPSHRTPQRLVLRSSTKNNNRHTATPQSVASQTRQLSTPPSGPSRRASSQRNISQTLESRSKRASETPKKRRMPSPPPDHVQTQGFIPDWRDPTMPYRAWTDIFYYAATAGGPDDLDVNWLINTATTCQAFCEPALAAVYRCPPILNSRKARRLAALLERPISETRFNYRVKVKSLYLDISVFPQSLIYKLIHPLPRLQELVFFSQYDQPPYRELDRTVRWHYNEEIFNALLPATDPSSYVIQKPYHTKLESWEWSGRLLGGPVSSIKDISRVHQQPSFAHVSKISFTNLQVPSLHKPRPKEGDEEAEVELYSEDCAVIDSVGKAISQLKSLKHLVFESSTVMNDRLLSQLPKDLTHLSLINCWEVKSEDLEPFLHSHGGHIRKLVLSHNQSLEMFFLTSLAQACPRLEELYMNLSYYRHHNSLSFVNSDADPLYDQALLPGQIPKWPSSIRVIDLEHVRHWSLEVAEVFLQSLIDSAANLPNLRHIALKTMLDIPWKARADMRNKWRERLNKVFLRPFEPPRYQVSLRQLEADEPTEVPTKKRKVRDQEPLRSSGRLAAQFSDSDSRHSTGSRDLRNRRDRPQYREPDTDEDMDFGSEAEEGSDVEDKPSPTQENTLEEAQPFIQGLCNVVSLVFDNQKPREMQYGMEDFRDDQAESDDDDWDGDKEEDDTVFDWR